MKEFYQKEWEKAKDIYKLPFLIVFILTLAIAAGGYIFLISNPPIVHAAMEQLGAQFENMGAGPDAEHSTLFWVIVLNNLQVSFFVLILGFIPVLFLPALSPVITGLSVSVVLAFTQAAGENPLSVFALGILPHGIIEMIGLFLCSAAGIYISLSIAKKIFSPNRDSIELTLRIGQAFKTYFGVVVPLIIIAALIEGFVTPHFLDMME
ncbi:stage II sporulation protein M [Thalassorhabdus alkalitolerans]|uniref:Stage II sporulation protein M n=1 Tax=Thalassorhabdus alkalitolerans TaxID=2282697 RepID=A0ABW0YQ62_9BACI